MSRLPERNGYPSEETQLIICLRLYRPRHKGVCRLAPIAMLRALSLASRSSGRCSNPSCYVGMESEQIKRLASGFNDTEDLPIRIEIQTRR